ncbi:sialomucin core protein 24-like [Plodia interpunctella]|uniref:sialomucin core protein 24-like n=1 Tax=Plodia interpunctella TaxID=58824 RepID=UPI002368764E|nr:sialomucin core protein 24-like [Plodia interpunctella]
MKQVIFICLLSVSMCLSDTTAQAGSPSIAQPPEKHDVATNTDKPMPVPANSPTPDKVTPAPAASNNTVPKNNTPTPTKDVTPASSTEKSTLPPSSVVPPNTSTVKPSTIVTPTTNATTTLTPDHKSSSTVTPKTVVPTPVQARGFDGASFVGGIILTLGLLAIGFMGFKYYKNQTERNYHTL